MLSEKNPIFVWKKNKPKNNQFPTRKKKHINSNFSHMSNLQMLKVIVRTYFLFHSFYFFTSLFILFLFIVHLFTSQKFTKFSIVWLYFIANSPINAKCQTVDTIVKFKIEFLYNNKQKQQLSTEQISRKTESNNKNFLFRAICNRLIWKYGM